MKKLFELAAKNKSLSFFDSDKRINKKIDELNIVEIPSTNEKKLAFLFLDNSIESITVFWSFMRSDHAIVLLNPNLEQGLKNKAIKTYNPFYVYDPSIQEHINYTSKTIEYLKIFVATITNEIVIHPKIKVLLSTSGTTGSPKFVKLSEENLIENALSISDYLPIKSDDVTPLNLPIYYSYGLSILNSNSIKGGKIVCTNKTVVEKGFWEDFNQDQYTTLAGVPYLYEMLNRIGFTKKQYPSLRYMTQAGGKLNNKLIQVFNNHCKENNAAFYVMYGQTEATARISYLPPNRINDKLGSIGKPIKNGEFQISDENEELLYKGPNVFGGYATKLNDLISYNQPSWLKTGDLGFKDDDGFFFIKGRIKRFVKLFGNRINLDDIENICKQHFSNRIFATKGFEDKKLLIAYQGEELSTTEVKSFLRDKLKIHPTSIKILRLEKLPLTSNGKINYQQIT